MRAWRCKDHGWAPLCAGVRVLQPARGAAAHSSFRVEEAVEVLQRQVVLATHARQEQLEGRRGHLEGLQVARGAERHDVGRRGPKRELRVAVALAELLHVALTELLRVALTERVDLAELPRVDLAGRLRVDLLLHVDRLVRHRVGPRRSAYGAPRRAQRLRRVHHGSVPCLVGGGSFLRVLQLRTRGRVRVARVAGEQIGGRRVRRRVAERDQLVQQIALLPLERCGHVPAVLEVAFERRLRLQSDAAAAREHLAAALDVHRPVLLHREELDLADLTRVLLWAHEVAAHEVLLLLVLGREFARAGGALGGRVPLLADHAMLIGRRRVARVQQRDLGGGQRQPLRRLQAEDGRLVGHAVRVHVYTSRR
mmetsp:Transcript_14825/g.37480  ORF Transcript_14825/g.37480 Transcript_14825/m.37480 type:complete len:367 (+) Transcript_14825:194-1294(+)